MRVDLGERSYDIHIGEGVLDRAGELVSGVCRGEKAAIITNPKIGELYADRLVKQLEGVGITACMVTIPAGERYKKLSTVARIYEALLDMKLDRTGIVIGLGGGVVGDIAGFVAASFLRGVDFMQVPTSLLAQVDSSIGGKTGVNLPRGKNLVGAFYQPKVVLIDLGTLATLPVREFRSGLAEIIKHGIIRDAEYFAFLEEHLDAVRKRDPKALAHTIRRSCEIKADVVHQDERESGLRRILNYGHTAGHAVERLTSYRRYKHGEAVGIGMVSAALAAREMGAEPELPQRVAALIRRAGLPTSLPEGIDPQEIVAAMGLDKKVAHGKLHVVLADTIGSAYVTADVPAEAWLRAFKVQACEF
ncbi:MAG: 3-dehydroquinate synthase [Armatimonadota bacterium]